MRGKKFARFIINEAAFVPNLLDIFNLIIRPTLIDYQGSADFAGTPKGMNGFWQLYNTMGDDWARWQMSSYENPHIPKSELDALKSTMIERAYMQEIMAEFLEDGGGVFRNVTRCATATRQEQGIKGHQYVIGADWGRTDDATVFMVIDIGTCEQCYMDRMTDTDFASQRVRLQALSRRFNDAVCLVEVNSIGQPQLEALQTMGVPVQGFQTTNATKLEIISALQLAFEQERIKILNDPLAISELMAYQAERLPSGLLRYGAPEGMDDDIVMALCLAWWAMTGGTTWIMFFGGTMPVSSPFIMTKEAMKNFDFSPWGGLEGFLEASRLGGGSNLSALKLSSATGSTTSRTARSSWRSTPRGSPTATTTGP